MLPTKEDQVFSQRRVGWWLLVARLSSGRTQADAAKALGLTASSYGDFERGVTAPSLRQLTTLAILFEVPLVRRPGRNNRQVDSRYWAPRLSRILRRVQTVTPRWLPLAFLVFMGGCATPQPSNAPAASASPTVTTPIPIAATTEPRPIPVFPAATFEPKTYTGDWTQLSFVRYPAGRYAFTWSAAGRDPQGQPSACRIVLRIDTSIPVPGVTSSTKAPPRERIPITARDVAAGAIERGSATVTVRGGEYDLLIDGYGCEWTVAVNAA